MTILAWCSNSPGMTATLDFHGHIVLPPELSRVAQAHPSRSFDVMVSTSGVIMLRPHREAQEKLVKSFGRLRGLEIQHRRDPIPEPPEL
jgi:hypothetical protein